jgi:hypothetical protein
VQSDDVLARVDAFYDRAWTRLTVYVTVALAFAGIIVPFLVQWQQRSAARRDEESLRRYVDAGIAQARDDIGKAVDDAVARVTDAQAAMEDSVRRLQRRVNHSTSGIFILQSNSLWDAGRMAEALQSLASALRYALEAGDEAFIAQRVSSLRDSSRQASALEALRDPTARAAIERTLAKLRAWDKDSKYAADIEAIELALQEANAATPDKPSAGKGAHKNA